MEEKRDDRIKLEKAKAKKIQRRQEAYDIVDVVMKAIEAGAPEDRIIGIVNDLLTIFLHNAVETEREACAAIADAEYRNPQYGNGRPLAGFYIASEIRARSKS